MQLTEVIFCDDVRFELGNKLSLMGVYDDKVKIASWNQATEDGPRLFTVWLYSRFMTDITDMLPEQLELQCEITGEVPMKIVKPVHLRAPGRPFVSFVKIENIPIKEQADILVRFKITASNGCVVPFSKDSRSEARISVELVREKQGVTEGIGDGHA